MLQNVEEDHHGVPAYGGGGLGKTSAQEYLTEHVAQWLIDAERRPIGVASRLIMPSGVRRSDAAFYTAMNNRLKLSNADRLAPQKGRDRLINFVKTRCGQAQLPLMVMFIDNAQRITRAEYDYLADVDEQLTDARLRLFLVFVRQSDATGVDVTDDWSDYPSHMVRRWFMATHPFQPLTGAEEVQHALSRYDTSATWPTPDMPFSRYFAKAAFEGGWTLASEVHTILEGVRVLREANRLPPSEGWPMATFTLTVRHLLASVAGIYPGFKGFTPADVQQALLASGYLRLEFVRCKLMSVKEAA
ncbi:MAG: ATP-binding protein [Proteobacteria bacterium]|nr:ATP-binding protein [Pseudomonadota bacterium]